MGGEGEGGGGGREGSLASCYSGASEARTATG